MNNFEIYVINLEKDTERLETIIKNLYPNKINRINAIYGKDQDYSNNKDIFFLSRYLVPKNPLASTLSHRLAIKTFLASSNNYGLILEDDAIPINKEYIKEINNVLDTAPDDWDIIKLDYSPDYSNSDFNKKPTILLSAYLINKRGASKILNKLVYYYSDVEINFFSDINIYNCPNKIFTQRTGIISNNQSGDRSNDNSNPLQFLGIENLKVIRFGSIELKIFDIILIIIFIILYYLYMKKIIKLPNLSSFRIN